MRALTADVSLAGATLHKADCHASWLQRTREWLTAWCVHNHPPAGTPPLVIKSSGKIAELEAQAYRELEDLQVWRWEDGITEFWHGAAWGKSPCSAEQRWVDAERGSG